jgi:thiol-disulfide isomerase/thioredoxin
VPQRADVMIALTIYSKPGCHLCDDMKAVVARVVRASALPITIEEIDITTDPDLEARYGTEIPVLVVDGRKAAKYRISEQNLMRLLSASGTAGESGGSGGSGRSDT